MPKLEMLAHDNIDLLVRSLRQTAKDSLYERCGTLRVLDMTHPLQVGDIYTDVNILEQVSKPNSLALSWPLLSL